MKLHWWFCDDIVSQMFTIWIITMAVRLDHIFALNPIALLSIRYQNQNSCSISNPKDNKDIKHSKCSSKKSRDTHSQVVNKYKKKIPPKKTSCKKERLCGNYRESVLHEKRRRMVRNWLFLNKDNRFCLFHIFFSLECAVAHFHASIWTRSVISIHLRDKEAI